MCQYVIPSIAEHSIVCTQHVSFIQTSADEPKVVLTRIKNKAPDVNVTTIKNKPSKRMKHLANSSLFNINVFYFTLFCHIFAPHSSAMARQKQCNHLTNLSAMPFEILLDLQLHLSS